MAKAVSLSLAAGFLSAALVLALLFGSLGAMVLAYLAPLPLFYVGLAYGVGAVVLAGLAGTAATAAVGWAAALGFLVTFAVPVAILVRQALLWREGPDKTRQWYPPGLLTTWLAGLAAAGFLVALAATSGTEGGLLSALRPALERALAVMSGAPAGMNKGAGDDLLQVMPGLIAASWFAMMAINGALAQGLAVRFGQNQRPSPAMADIDLPGSLVVILAVAAAVGALGGATGYIGITVEAIVVMAYFFQGLGLLHALAYRTQAPFLVLMAVYGVLAIFIAATVVVALLGVIEQWVQWRRRWAASGPKREIE
jgi:Predicted membrane protein (DUF2232)